MKKDLKLTEIEKTELKTVIGGRAACPCNWIFDEYVEAWYSDTAAVREDYNY